MSGRIKVSAKPVPIPGTLKIHISVSQYTIQARSVNFYFSRPLRPSKDHDAPTPAQNGYSLFFLRFKRITAPHSGQRSWLSRRSYPHWSQRPSASVRARSRSRYSRNAYRQPKPKPVTIDPKNAIQIQNSRMVAASSQPACSSRSKMLPKAMNVTNETQTPTKTNRNSA